MLKAVVLKEWRQKLRQGHVRWVFILMLGLIIGSGMHTFFRYLDEQTVHEQASALSREDWEAQEAKNPHSAAHYGLHVFKPWQLGAIFDPGILPYTGTTVFVEAHTKNDAMHPPIADRTSLARWGDLSPAFILLYLVPLLMIVLHFDAIAGERETQMDTWTASTGLPFRTWLLGKWLAAGATPLLFMIACLGGTWFASGFDLGEIQRLAWLVLGFGLFFVVVLNGILAVSSLIRKPATSLLLLLGFWIVASWTVPKIAATMAENRYPAPGLAELKQRMDQAKREGLMGHSTSAERRKELEDKVLQEYGVSSIQELPINFDAVAMQAGEEYGYQVFDHFYEEVLEQQDRQQTLFQGFGLLSPMMPAAFLSMALAQTDGQAHWHFNQAAEMYRRQFVEMLNREMMLHSKTGEWGYHSHQSTWAKLPRFQYEPPTPSESLGQVSNAYGVLAIWVLVSGIFLFIWVPKMHGWRTR